MSSTITVVWDISALPQLLAAANIEQRDGEENNCQNNHQEVLHGFIRTAAY
jgi:hypothetical protein